MLIKRFTSLFNPDMYHGWGRTKNYFEGWYIKVVNANESQAIAIIPGISMGSDGEQHAFIQVLNGKKLSTDYYRFPAPDFKPSESAFEVHLGDNFFSKKYVKLTHEELHGELHFEGHINWPSSTFSPGIMGWYSFVPFMQCYHGVVSMNHRISGHLTVKGETISFDNGLGYMEKDWGRSFPSSWFWMQTNHFNSPASMMSSVARIPWLGSHFIGHISGLWLDGKLYQFATYNNTKILTKILTDDTLELELKNRKHRMHILAHKGATGELIAPASGNMTGKVNESMTATVDVQLFENEQLIFEDTGRNAGLEVGGNYEELL